MDIVVYIKNGKNEELRYAIRSWCQNLNFDKLCVVGGPKPDWLEPDIYIENPTTKNKMLQCYNNVKLAMTDDRLSEDVLLLMDDVFVLRPTEWKVNYNRGTLAEQLERSRKQYGETAYGQQVKFTHDLLTPTKPNPLSFEEHAPFKCNRKLMLQVLDAMSGEAIDHILYRSVYGNTFNCPTKFKLDVKLQTAGDRLNSHDEVVSTGGSAFNGAAGTVIKDWFPNPSKYER